MAKAILIVDDDKGIRDAFTRILQRKGYQAESAATIQEAIEKAKRTPFDLALIDVMLPGENGIDLMPQLQRIRPDMIKIVVTGYFSDELDVRARSEGAAAILTKPVKLEILLDIIQEQLNKSTSNKKTT